MSNETSQLPNIVFIHTDQQRWDTLGCYGASVAHTPNLDQLAEEGVRFDHCYTTNPVCMPSRASWVTGQYPSQNGCWQNGVPLSESSDMIQAHLKERGYKTAWFGKIHLDNVWARREPHPYYGFEEVQECEGDPFCFDDYFRWLSDDGLYDDYMKQFKEGGHLQGYTREIPEEKHMNNWVTSRTEGYFERRATDNNPFFVSVGFFDPHHPFDPCEPYASRFNPDDMPLPIYQEGEEEKMTPPAKSIFDKKSAYCLDADHIRRVIAAYHAMITHIDAMVGRIMKSLRDNGLEENTVVIFTSDHGEMLGDHGVLHKGPLFYDGATRVPLIYRFPQHWGVTGVDQDFVSHVDLAPTIAALTGANPPTLSQGRPVFNENGELRPYGARNAALTEWRERRPNTDGPYTVARCLRTHSWKYVYYQGEDYGELYDLENDPEECNNLWGDSNYSEQQQQMHNELFNFMLDNEPLPEREDVF